MTGEFLGHVFLQAHHTPSPSPAPASVQCYFLATVDRRTLCWNQWLRQFNSNAIITKTFQKFPNLLEQRIHTMNWLQMKNYRWKYIMYNSQKIIVMSTTIFIFRLHSRTRCTKPPATTQSKLTDISVGSQLAIVRVAYIITIKSYKYKYYNYKRYIQFWPVA